MFRSTKFFKSENGQIEMGLLALIIITGAIWAILQFSDRFSSEGISRTNEIKRSIHTRSGIETMITALRQAEVDYLASLILLECVSANTFLDALADGHRCKKADQTEPGNAITLFDNGLTTPPGVSEQIYDVTSNCLIKSDFGCINSRPLVVNIGQPNLLGLYPDSKPIGEFSFSFRLIRIDTASKTLYIKVEVSRKNRGNKIYEIQFRDSNINMAHMDADGKVKQSNPNPNDLCTGMNGPYTELKLYDDATGDCINFSQLGGGTGLAYYRDRYFSFRPADGQVFDLKEAANPASLFFPVSEAGMIGTTQVFPPYSKEILFNAEDMTILEDQIYYVKGENNNVAIWALINPDPADPNHSKKVCDLGQKGWGQAVVGLSSKAWSDRLIPHDVGNSKTATFYVKTFSGDLLTVLVWTNDPSSPPSIPEFDCVVLKDNDIQIDENKRTYGFDKIVTDQAFIYW
jgi:hypothetical protein